MEKDVCEGISIDQKSGAARAWAFMKYRHIPQQVILRVLAEPHLRRGSKLGEPASETEALGGAGLIHLWRRAPEG